MTWYISVHILPRYVQKLNSICVGLKCFFGVLSAVQGIVLCLFMMITRKQSMFFCTWRMMKLHLIIYEGIYKTNTSGSIKILFPKTIHFFGDSKCYRAKMVDFIISMLRKRKQSLNVELRVRSF